MGGGNPALLKEAHMPRRSRKDKTANQQLDELNQYSPVIIPYAADSDHSTAKAAFVAPFAMCTGITCANYQYFVFFT